MKLFTKDEPEIQKLEALNLPMIPTTEKHVVAIQTDWKDPIYASLRAWVPAAMISGVMSGIAANNSGSRVDKAMIRSGTDDACRPLPIAASATLVGRRLVILEWKIAVSNSRISTGSSNEIKRLTDGHTKSHAERSDASNETAGDRAEKISTVSLRSSRAGDTCTYINSGGALN